MDILDIKLNWNIAIDNTAEWCNDNIMSSERDKTKFMLITTCQIFHKISICERVENIHRWSETAKCESWKDILCQQSSIFVLEVPYCTLWWSVALLWMVPRLIKYTELLHSSSGRSNHISQLVPPIDFCQAFDFPHLDLLLSVNVSS